MKKILTYALPFVVLIVGFIIMRQLLKSKDESPKRTQPVRPRQVNARVVALKDIRCIRPKGSP